MTQEYIPAYHLSGSAAGNQGPQCSGHPEDFCFLCEYAESPTLGGDQDIVKQIKQVAHNLSDQGKELPVIISAVQQAYGSNAKALVVWTNRERGGVVVKSPHWSIASIQRHLLYNGEFESLFTDAVDQIFHSLIVHLNDSAVDRRSGIVNEPTRKALMDTISRYGKWKNDTSGGSRRKAWKKAGPYVDNNTRVTTR